jgi:phage terminase small subunit
MATQPPDDLTEGELRFCEEYAADPNATQAYRRAYPGASYATALTEGPSFLGKPRIQAEVEKIREAYRKTTRVNSNRTLRATAEIAFADLADLFEPDPDNGGLPRPKKWSDVPPAMRRAIQTTKISRRRLKGKKGDSTQWEVESIEFRLFSKMDAIKTLCQNLGLTTDAPAVREALEELRRRDAERLAAGDAAGGEAGGGAAGGP